MDIYPGPPATMTNFLVWSKRWFFVKCKAEAFCFSKSDFAVLWTYCLAKPELWIRYCWYAKCDPDCKDVHCFNQLPAIATSRWGCFSISAPFQLICSYMLKWLLNNWRTPLHFCNKEANVGYVVSRSATSIIQDYCRLVGLWIGTSGSDEQKFIINCPPAKNTGLRGKQLDMKKNSRFSTILCFMRTWDLNHCSEKCWGSSYGCDKGRGL